MSAPLSVVGAPPHAAPRPNRRLLLAAVVVALGLRALGLAWGLPGAEWSWSFHPDEYRVVDAARRVVAEHTLDPTSFKYGSLSVYLPALLAWPLGLLGGLEDARSWHLFARCLTLALGVLTVPATWGLGRRVAGPVAADLSALALALAPGHVLSSAWATPDVPATLLTTLALLCALRLLHGAGPGALLAGGACAGLAAGFKYSAGLAALPVVLAAWAGARATASPGRALARGLAAGAVSLATFVLVTPFAFVAPRAFVRDLRYELILHPRAGHGNLFLGTGDGWTHHLLANLPFLLGWLLLLCALLGLVVLLRRGRSGALVCGFALLVFLLLGFSRVRFMRYLLPIVPLLCIAAGALLAGRAPRLRGVRLAVSSAILGYAALLCALQATALRSADPRIEILRRAQSVLEPGTLIGSVVTPSFFHPPFVRENGGPGIRARFRASLAAGESPFRFAPPTGFDARALRESAPRAFVLSEYDWVEGARLGDPDTRAFLDALAERYEVIDVATGLGPGSRWLFGLGLRPAPHDWCYPFLEMRLYR